MEKTKEIIDYLKFSTKLRVLRYAKDCGKNKDAIGGRKLKVCIHVSPLQAFVCGSEVVRNHDPKISFPRLEICDFRFTDDFPESN